MGFLQGLEASYSFLHMFNTIARTKNSDRVLCIAEPRVENPWRSVAWFEFVIRGGGPAIELLGSSSYAIAGMQCVAFFSSPPEPGNGQQHPVRHEHWPLDQVQHVAGMLGHAFSCVE